METLQKFYNELDEDTIVKSVLGTVAVGTGLWLLEDWYRERQKNQPLKDKVNSLWNTDPKEVSVGIKYIADKSTTAEEKETFVENGALQGFIHILKKSDFVDSKETSKIFDVVQSLISSNPNSRYVFANNGGISILLDYLFKNENTFQRKVIVTLLKATEFDHSAQILSTDVPFGSEACYKLLSESDERFNQFLSYLNSRDAEVSSAVIGILANCSNYSYFAKRLSQLPEEDTTIEFLIKKLSGSSQKTKFDSLKTLTNIANQNFDKHAELLMATSNLTPDNILDLYHKDKTAPEYVLDLFYLMFEYLKRESKDDEDEIETANKIASMMVDKNKGLKKTQDLFTLIVQEKYKKKVEALITILTSNDFLTEDLKKTFERISGESKEKAMSQIRKKKEDAEKKEKEREMMMMQMMGLGGM
eukprot:gene10850-3470_t